MLTKYVHSAPRLTVTNNRIEGLCLVISSFVIQNKIAGQGIGYIDTNLLASCLASGTRILAYDTHLAVAAQKLGCLYQ